MFALVCFSRRRGKEGGESWIRLLDISHLENNGAVLYRRRSLLHIWRLCDESVPKVQVQGAQVLRE